VVAAVIVTAMALMGSAFAQSGSEELPGDTVRGKFFDRQQTAPGDDVLGTLFPGGRDDSALPFTGSDLALFVIVGAAAVGTGAAIVRRTRASKAEV
jgi:hypothetical protein